MIAAAGQRGIAVAVHLEPYRGRSVASTIADVIYLQGLGVRTFYLYRPFDLPAADWAPANDRFHAQGLEVFAQTALVGAAATGHFTGVYTYDTLVYRGGLFKRLCRQAHARGLLCAPSVGPGYDAQRATGDARVKPRRNGLTYDSMWRAAIRAGADRITITSFNEWQEGTQIEPAPAPRAGQRNVPLRLVRGRVGAARRDCRNGISRAARPSGRRSSGCRRIGCPERAPAEPAAQILPVSFGRGCPHRLRAARAASERADDRRGSW